MTGLDRDWDHLYPAFRLRLQEVLAETSEATGVPWYLAEGYRSQERQTYLFAQGRSRPGPVVTWMRTPKHHGSGLAADCYPKIPVLGKAPRAWYERFRRLYAVHGLENPAWAKGDLGHVQWPASDRVIHVRAAAWCRAGFPAGAAQADGNVAGPPAEIPVYVGGELVPDADAYRAEGHIYLALRPVTDSLDWVIAQVRGGEALVVDDNRSLTVPIVPRGGRGFVAAAALRPLASVEYGGAPQALRIEAR